LFLGGGGRGSHHPRQRNKKRTRRHALGGARRDGVGDQESTFIDTPRCNAETSGPEVGWITKAARWLMPDRPPPSAGRRRRKDAAAERASSCASALRPRSPVIVSSTKDRTGPMRAPEDPLTKEIFDLSATSTLPMPSSDFRALCRRTRRGGPASSRRFFPRVHRSRRLFETHHRAKIPPAPGEPWRPPHARGATSATCEFDDYRGAGRPFGGPPRHRGGPPSATTRAIGILKAGRRVSKERRGRKRRALDLRGLKANHPKKKQTPGRKAGRRDRAPSAAIPPPTGGRTVGQTRSFEQEPRRESRRPPDPHPRRAKPDIKDGACGPSNHRLPLPGGKMKKKERASRRGFLTSRHLPRSGLLRGDDQGISRFGRRGTPTARHPPRPRPGRACHSQS